MQFNGEANGLDLYHDALRWTGASSSQYTIEEFTRDANFALDRVTTLILKSDAKWKWRDQNLSSELVDVTTNVQTTVAKYATTVTWLKVRRVRVKDANGTWVTLRKYDRDELTDSQLAETGTPWGYYLLGGFVYLVGTPNYNSTGGLEVQYQRGADYFATTDTTKVPGYASPFHRLVSLYSALDYVEANTIKNRAAAIKERIGQAPSADGRLPGSGMERELVEFYSARDDDQQPRINLQSEDYGAAAMGGGGDDKPFGFNF